jgi:hypothetical protein
LKKERERERRKRRLRNKLERNCRKRRKNRLQPSQNLYNNPEEAAKQP